MSVHFSLIISIKGIQTVWKSCSLFVNFTPTTKAFVFTSGIWWISKVNSWKWPNSKGAKLFKDFWQSHFKGKLYTCRWTKCFCFPCNMWSTLKWKNSFPGELILSFNSRTPFQKGLGKQRSKRCLLSKNCRAFLTCIHYPKYPTVALQGHWQK